MYLPCGSNSLRTVSTRFICVISIAACNSIIRKLPPTRQDVVFALVPQLVTEFDQVLPVGQNGPTSPHVVIILVSWNDTIPISPREPTRSPLFTAHRLYAILK